MAYDRLVPIQPPTTTMSAKCAEIVSGGDLVEWASGTDVVGSGASTYATTDFVVQPCVTASQCVGIALETQTSGGIVSVAMDGVFILPAGSGGVSGGNPITVAGYENMVVGVTGSAIGQAYRGIGRSLTKATELTGLVIARISV